MHNVQNGQTQFKNLAANAAYFGTLCIKGLRYWYRCFQYHTVVYSSIFVRLTLTGKYFLQRENFVTYFYLPKFFADKESMDKFGFSNFLWKHYKFQVFHIFWVFSVLYLNCSFSYRSLRKSNHIWIFRHRMEIASYIPQRNVETDTCQNLSRILSQRRSPKWKSW